MASFVRHGKKIVAIGRNYAAHAKELNNAVPKEPFFFLKPTSSYLPSGGKVEIPRGIVAHHEVELGLVIGKAGKNIPQASAESHIAGYTTRNTKANCVLALFLSIFAARPYLPLLSNRYPYPRAYMSDKPTLCIISVQFYLADHYYPILSIALPPADGSTSTLTVISYTRYFHLDITSVLAKAALAVDMTARNLQDKVRKAGLPWSAAKGFDTFTPVGSFLPKTAVKDAHDLRLSLKINGETKQDGTTADMIFRIPRLVEHVSSIMSLEEGDVILTGTPSGVGPIQPGDKIECALSQPNGEELLKLDFGAIQREGGYSFKED